MNAAQPTTGVRVPFLHGFPATQSPGHELASLERADAWLNTPPLTASALRGKVVLIDFWTYTCINCCARFPMFAPGPTNMRSGPGGDRRPRTRVLV